MKYIYPNRLFLFLLTLACIHQSSAEGTFQLTPTLASDNHGVIQLWANNDPARNAFTYGAANKLRFTIASPTEVVYFGISYDAADITGTSSLWYRIISPSGMLAFPETGWQQITNSGAGSIASWTEAAAGPNTSSGNTGGYTPLSFLPFEDGDYYIEFYRNSTAAAPENTPVSATGTAIDGQEKIQTRLRFFDLTVTDVPNGNPVRGKLFATWWDIHTNGTDNPFIAAMYVYTDDGVVSLVELNGLRSSSFVITANATGVAQTGNKFKDAKSVTGASGYPQYKIFLNDPDLATYPTRIFGSIMSNPTITGSNPAQLCINVVTDRFGRASLLLNFNEIPGYQENTADILLHADLEAGTTCVIWNCKDGLGNIVEPGTQIDMTVNYTNGEAHIQLYNVANNPYGLIVKRIRPAGSAGMNPQLFWNDSELTDGTINAGGCASGLSFPTDGCHAWGSDVNGDVRAGNAPADWGLGKTINTTWYSNVITNHSTHTLYPFVSLNLPSTSASVDITAAPFELTGGSPAGGTYSGAGVTDNLFDPAAAGPGEHEITYTYTFEEAAATLANARTTAAGYTYTSTQKISVTSTTTPTITGNTVTKGIYPNPNAGNFHVVGSAGNELIIYDAQGRIVQRTSVTDADLFIQAGFKQGMYHYILRGISGNTTGGSFTVQ